MATWRVTSLLLSGLIVVAGTTSARGAILLTLSSSTDLTMLSPGDSATIEVTLSGLNAGDTLDFLAATVDFDGAILGTPTITVGPIVPDPTGVLSTATSGQADFNYDDLFAVSGLPITSNGTFFSFDVTVVGTGSGSIVFSFVDSFGFDSGFEELDPVTAGSDLPFQSSSPVPEPSSWLLWSLAATGLMGGRRAWNHRRPHWRRAS